LWPSKYAKMCFRPGVHPGPHWESSQCFHKSHDRLGRGYPFCTSHHSPFGCQILINFLSCRLNLVGALPLSAPPPQKKYFVYNRPRVHCVINVPAYVANKHINQTESHTLVFVTLNLYQGQSRSKNENTFNIRESGE